MGSVVLWISAVVLTVYGVVCLVAPEVPAASAGLTMTGADALAEIGAMYGGLQTGFGLFCLLAAVIPAYRRAGLLVLLMCIGPLALARLFWAFAGGDPVGAYTWGALAYEVVTAGLAALALWRS